MNAPIRIVVADDHPMFRFGLCTALANAPELEIVGAAVDGVELIRLVEEKQPRVVLTDITMPHVDGTTAIGTLAQRFPEVGVLVLTMHADDETVMRALRAGAHGYLLKGADRDEIVRAVLTVAAGGTTYGGEVGRRLNEQIRSGGTAAVTKVFTELTDREHEILEQVAIGRGNHEIADRLFLSEKTVRNNVAMILSKLHLRDRAAAVAKARDRGLGCPEKDRASNSFPLDRLI